MLKALRKNNAVNYILLLVFHVTLNGHNTILKKTMYGDRWRSLDIQIVLHVSVTTMCFVLYKPSSFGVKLVSHDLMHAASPYLSHRFSIMGKKFHSLMLRSMHYPLRKLILHNLFLVALGYSRERVQPPLLWIN